MKTQRLILIAVVLIASYFGLDQSQLLSDGAPTQQGVDSPLARAYANRQSDVQVRGVGEVIKVLADDLKGSRHQRFLLEVAGGQTLLIAHNIDLAPKISSLRAGDEVEFNGEYEWNERGGVVHWTHHDPQKRHTPGWLKHKGRTYE